MSCKIYKLLYRAVPVKAWQALLIRRHFASCPVCREELAPDEDFLPAAVGFTPENVELPENLWNRIEARIKEKIPAGGSQIRWHGWKWAAAAAVILILLLLPSPLRKDSNPPLSGNERHMVVRNREIVIHSIMVENRQAQTVYFQPGNQDRLIVWVK